MYYVAHPPQVKKQYQISKSTTEMPRNQSHTVSTTDIETLLH